MSQISQLSKLAISVVVSLTVTAAVNRPPLSLPQLPLFPSNQIMWFAIQFCDWLVWCLFPPVGICFLAFKHFLLADTFMKNARFYHFFLHQTQSKRDSNVCEKAWRTLFIVCPVLDAPACPSSQGVGRGGGLAASYLRTSTDYYSSLLFRRCSPLNHTAAMLKTSGQQMQHSSLMFS